MKYEKVFLLSILAVALGIGHLYGKSNNTTLLTSYHQTFEPNSVEVIPDTSATTYEQILEVRDWIAYDEGFDESVSDSFWVRFTLQGQGESVPLFFSFGDEWGEITFYGPDGMQKTGWRVPLSERRVEKGRLLLLAESPSEGKSFTYYVHLQESFGNSSTYLPLAPNILSVAGFADVAADLYWMFGLFVGALVIIFLYHVGLFDAMKDGAFSFYLLYIFAFLTNYSLDVGVSPLISRIWPENPMNGYHFRLIISGLGSIAYLLFSRSFLNLKEHLRWGSKLLIIGSVLVFLSLLGYFFTLNLSYYYTVYAIVFSLFFFLAIVIGVILWIRKVPLAKYYVIASLFLFLGGLLNSLAGQPWWPDSLPTGLIGKIGVVGEIIVFAFGMARRFNMQREALSAQQLNQERLLRRKEEEKQELIAKQNMVLEQRVKERTTEVVAQRNELARMNQDLTASINYARRIQEAILPDIEELHQMHPESFLLFRPRDIVSGDFYWFSEHTDQAGEKCIIVGVIDCTGHGVPGAFMSLVGHDLLSEIIIMLEERDPGKILGLLNERVQSQLRQNERQSYDGMDMSLCVIYPDSRKLQFSGARNPLLVTFGEELLEIKADRNTIGGSQGANVRMFTTHTIDLNEIAPKQAVNLYLLSDGYQDQFGGPHNRKFMKGKLKTKLATLQSKSMDEQCHDLAQTLDDWMAGQRQIDDITVLGMRM